MQDCKDRVIYLGKAKNLKNRLKSYFPAQYNNRIDPKTSALIKEIHNIEITVTKNEVEALLLENKLINQLKPKYNIIFRDDKSYPYIALTQEEYPSIRYVRNKDPKNNNKKKTQILYGPYPNVNAVKTSLDLLIKIFKLRSCTSNFFNNRTRPCLEYQLKRCLAPCVGLIDPNSYAEEVDKVKLFLQNKSNLLIKTLNHQMHSEASVNNYETAAYLRDQIKALKLLQNKQTVLNNRKIDVDVLGIAVGTTLICIHLLRIRQGNILYSKQFFSKKTIFTLNNTDSELLEEFILQHYLTISEVDCISEIIVSIDVFKNMKAISKVINIKLFCARKGDKLSWQKIAQTSAEEALRSRATDIRKQKDNFNKLSELLGRNKPINRISCFDVSHTGGKETVAACVVFNSFGKEQSSYRLFNIVNHNPGDDYQALRHSITRYMERFIDDPTLMPDVIIVDGGKGQLAVAEQVIHDLKKIWTGAQLSINLLGIAKGRARKFGLETIYLTSDGAELNFQFNHPVFKLLLKIRDEAHRFVVKSHRNKRDKI